VDSALILQVADTWGSEALPVLPQKSMVESLLKFDFDFDHRVVVCNLVSRGMVTYPAACSTTSVMVLGLLPPFTVA
jgi:hypothetical protein